MSNVELKGLKGLRGLNSLTADATVSSLSNEQIEKIPHQFLIPGKYQPRKQFDEAVLNELADSIKTQGIIQPLIVRKIDPDKYEIIAGERRWRAAKIAGLTHVPVIIREIEDNVAFAFAIIENIQRENLNPIEEAQAFARFRDEFSMKHDEIANMVGRSRASVTNTMRLLMLEPEVRNLLEEGRLDMGHARALLTLEANQQIRIADLIVAKQLSVRDTEKLVQSAKEAKTSAQQIKQPSFYHDQCEAWARQLSEKFSTKVSVKLNSKGTGKVTIQIDSPDEIDWLIEHVNVD
ncbi:MAG: ParB/RepB/Spo0J family partition protein [Legionellales bacterium]|nr:ParB/RepB/Spo0J family partition protein [Legionellales bacterium]